MRSTCSTFVAVLLAAGLASAIGEERWGIVNQKAPSWGVQQWINLPQRKSSLDIEDYRGKVVYLFCFQSWCPGCHSSGFPTLQRMIQRYRGNDAVAFVGVQTVFEGFSSNTFERARKVARDYSLDIPVGQSGQEGRRSELMGRYRTGGTPWVVIVDAQGVVRYNDFHVDVRQGGELIDRLIDEAGSKSQASLPISRTGKELIGSSLELKGLRWINTPDHGPLDLNGKVTLLRWWTNTCPYCTRSLLAITALSRQFARRGFQTAAVYHPKPLRQVSDSQILREAQKREYHGFVAADMDWGVLERIYHLKHPTTPTSVSFILDRAGKVRYVHPGPVFHPSDDPGDASANRDYEEIKAVIEKLLSE